MYLTQEHFRELVIEALDDLPVPFRRAMKNIEIVVEDTPPFELQKRFARLLLGLYQGVPLQRRSVMGMQLPDKISIYKRNIESICSSEEQIRRRVRTTLMHEIGHHFGLNEKQLRDAGY